jgi:prephenate dehydratase
VSGAVSVAYAGRDGAHAAAASEQLFPLGELLPLPSFTAVAEAAAVGDVAFGVLPIESSISGPIAETHDLLQATPLSIADETVLQIRHCLVGVENVPLEQIRVVRSHAAALDQCRQLLAGMPWATAIAAGTTAEAAAEVAEGGDPSVTAIAGERAAVLYGLQVIDGDVGDHEAAYTRFVSVTNSTRLDRSAEDWRTAFSFVTDRARSTARSSRSPVTASTSCSSSRGRSRTRPGATASTPSSPATRSTRRFRRRSPRCAAGRAG